MRLCTCYAVVQAFCSAAVTDVRKDLIAPLRLCLVLNTSACNMSELYVTIALILIYWHAHVRDVHFQMS